MSSKITSDDYLAVFTRFAIAAVFAISGAAIGTTYERSRGNPQIGVAFALLCFFCFWRSAWFLVIAPIVVASWYLARLSVFATPALGIPDIWTMLFTAGALGGLGLGACDAIYSKRFRLVRWVLTIALGGLAGLSFGPWGDANLANRSSGEERAAFEVAFAIWWGVMGAWLNELAQRKNARF